MLIFTLIFSPKTNKSYKITLFTTTNHPNFQNFPQKPLFFLIFRLFLSFFPLFSSVFLSFTIPRPSSIVYRPAALRRNKVVR